MLSTGSSVWEATIRTVSKKGLKCAVPCRLSGNQYKTLDRDLERLVAFKRLRSLSLSQCGGIRSLKGLAHLPGLRTLELNFCTGLKPGALRVLAQLPELRKLDLSGCSAVTDECMSDIAGTHSLSPASGTAATICPMSAPAFALFSPHQCIWTLLISAFRLQYGFFCLLTL